MIFLAIKWQAQFNEGSINYILNRSIAEVATLKLFYSPDTGRITQQAFVLHFRSGTKQL